MSDVLRPPAEFHFDFTPLRQRRRFLDVTQRELGLAIHRHPITVNRLEKGACRNPSLALLVEIGRALGTPVNQLFQVVDGPRK